MAVLELLATHPDERFTLSEVARRCSLNKATAHALLNALSDRGVLLRHPDEKRYSLGPRLVAIGDAARRGYTAVDFAPAVLNQLSAATGLAASAWRADGDRVTCVARSGVAERIRGARPQAALPLVPPVGLVFMAWSDGPTVEAWLARAGAAESVGSAVEALPAIRRQGFAVMEASPEWCALTALPGANRGLDPGLAVQRELLRAVAHQSLVAGEIDARRAYRPADISAPVFGSVAGIELVLSLSFPGTGTVEPVHGTDLRALAARLVAAADRLTEAVRGRRPEPRT